jgi:hypothetical protein
MKFEDWSFGIWVPETVKNPTISFRPEINKTQNIYRSISASIFPPVAFNCYDKD